MLKVPLRSVFYSNTLLHPSFCGKCIRIQVPSQRNFQDGGDLVLLNEPNVFQTSGKKNVGRNYSLITNRSFPPKSGQDPTRTGKNFSWPLQLTIDSYNRLHAYLTTSFLHYFFAKLERKYPQSEVCEI